MLKFGRNSRIKNGGTEKKGPRTLMCTPSIKRRKVDSQVIQIRLGGPDLPQKDLGLVQ